MRIFRWTTKRAASRFIARVRPRAGATFPTISAEQIDLGEGDPLADEVRAFVESCATRGSPPVTADDGLRVMELSERIKAVMVTDASAT